MRRVNKRVNGYLRMNLALRTALIYGVVAGLWILLSDHFVGAIATTPQAFTFLSTLKGWFFVLATAVMLHSLIRRGLTRLERSERVLIDSERRLTDTINFLPDPTFVIDCSGRVISWNIAMEELTGVNAESIIGKGEYAYSLPFYGRRVPMLVDLALNPSLSLPEGYDSFSKDRDTLIAEVCLSDFRERTVYLWAKARALYDYDGNLVGAIEAVRDITEHKIADEERRLQQERELQIKAEAEQAKQLFYQRTIYSVTDGKLNLVDHARIADIIGADTAGVEIRNSDGLTYARDILADEARKVGMDEDRVFSLCTAFGEAAANAVKHAHGGSVRIGFSDGLIRVCISDNGEGMDQLILPTATLLSGFSTKTSMGLGYSLILGLVDRVYLATDKSGTSIVLEQAIRASVHEISLEKIPDTW